MANPCPKCGGPLQPPDDFCQRCLDADLDARKRVGGGYREEVHWYQQCTPYLVVGLGLCLIQVITFEAATRPALRRQAAHLKGSITPRGVLTRACVADNRYRALQWVKGDAAYRGEKLSKSELETRWRAQAAKWCTKPPEGDTSADARKQRAELLRAPLSFYVYILILGGLLAVLTWWSRARPLLPSALAVALTVVALIAVATSDLSNYAWTPQYVLLGVNVFVCTIAAINGVQHTRD